MDDMVRIPGGFATLGSPSWMLDWLTNEGQAFPVEWFNDETPERVVPMREYWMDRYPVTVAEFRDFARSTGYRSDAERRGCGMVYDDYWEERPGACWHSPAGLGSGTSGYDGHPVVHVSWNDANAYASWVGKRLPTEAEWEVAAKGPGFRIWPWGDDWDPYRANTAEYQGGSVRSLDRWRDWWRTVRSWSGTMPRTTPIGAFSERGDSVFGCSDMAGNVYEWNSTRAYLYEDRADSDATLRKIMGRYRVIRGGSWMNFRYQVRCAERMYGDPDGWSNFALGFRCAKDV